MLIQNNTTWAKMPLGQKVTWATVYLGKDTTWAMLAGAIVAWAKKALGNRGLGKSGSTLYTVREENSRSCYYSTLRHLLTHDI